MNSDNKNCENQSVQESLASCCKINRSSYWVYLCYMIRCWLEQWSLLACSHDDLTTDYFTLAALYLTTWTETPCHKFSRTCIIILITSSMIRNNRAIRLSSTPTHLHQTVARWNSGRPPCQLAYQQLEICELRSWISKTKTWHLSLLKLHERLISLCENSVKWIANWSRELSNSWIREAVKRLSAHWWRDDQDVHRGSRGMEVFFLLGHLATAIPYVSKKWNLVGRTQFQP